MKISVFVLLFVCSLMLAAVMEPVRDGMDFFAGVGAWIPGILNDDNQLSVGPVFQVGVETPMFQANQFRLAAGFASCGSDRSNYDGISAVMLNLSYRNFPFYRPYAGPRGLEPFFGFTGGGIIAWDSVVQGDSKSTGGAMLGAELGTRMKVSETMFLDITLAGEWVPIGSSIAGEEEDLSGIRIQGSLVF